MLFSRLSSIRKLHDIITNRTYVSAIRIFHHISKSSGRLWTLYIIYWRQNCHWDNGSWWECVGDQMVVQSAVARRVLAYIRQRPLFRSSGGRQSHQRLLRVADDASKKRVLIRASNSVGLHLIGSSCDVDSCYGKVIFSCSCYEWNITQDAMNEKHTV